MGMGIGTNVKKPDEGNVKGHQESVACGVWFTSTGRTIPKMIKFKGREGEIHTLTDIHVICSEEKFYCGIPTIEYECEVGAENRRESFRLIFYVEKKEWKVISTN